jgi:alkylated DNA nucleotide flippase Atl1
MPLDHAFKPKVGTYGDFAYVVSVPHDTRMKDFGMMPSELGDEIMRCYLERGMREPLSIVKAILQAAINDIEQEEARKIQDFQDREARRMRRVVEDKARRQDTPHHGRVCQSQVEIPLSYQQFCASIWYG